MSKYQVIYSIRLLQHMKNHVKVIRRSSGNAAVFAKDLKYVFDSKEVKARVVNTGETEQMNEECIVLLLY